MLEIFAPYLSFISFLIVIGVNILLIFLKSQWYIFIIANVIVSLILIAVGIPPYNFVIDIVKFIIDFFKSIFEGIFARDDGKKWYEFWKLRII